MIKAVIETQADKSDSQSKFELFDMNGLKILEFDSYSIPSEQSMNRDRPAKGQSSATLSLCNNPVADA